MGEFPEAALLYYPVLRQGFIVSSGREFKRGAAEGIANCLAERSSSMLETIADAFRRVEGRAANGSSLRAARARQASLRPSPTLVVDFPAFVGKIGSTKVQLRSCVTVCVDHKQSKIWTRVNGNSADISESEVNSLFNLFESAACDINEGILSKYRSILAEMTDEKISLEKVYEISVRTVSHDEAFVEDYIEEVFGAGNPASVAPALKKKVERAIKSIDARFASVPGLSVEKTGDKRSRRQIGFIGVRSPVGPDANFPLHQVRLVYAMEYDDRRASMAGFGYDPYLREAGPNTSLSHVASANVAVEYGGLF